jgi:hypothetical protein
MAAVYTRNGYISYGGSLSFKWNNYDNCKYSTILIKSQRCKGFKNNHSRDLDYNGIFDDVYSKYLSSFDNTSVKTSNMGSLYKLKYDIVFKESFMEKALIDELRCRNGNLEISISNQEVAANEL